MALLKHKFLHLLSAVACLLSLAACGDNETFTIEGTVDGNATINLRFVYYSDNNLVRGLTAARDGKFEYKGSVSAPTIIEILDNDYRPLGRLFVANGDRIECHLTRNAPNDIKVSGSDISSRWAKFLNDNSSALATPHANDLVARYVSDNPDDIVSTLLMLTSYDASYDAMTADSLMATINPDVRPSALVDGFNSLLLRLVSESTTEKIAPIPCLNMNDSLVDADAAASPWSLIVISDNSSGRADSITPALRRLDRKSMRPTLQLLDISVDRDTIAWHKSVRADSASWRTLWVAGSLASPGIDRLGVPSVPYFIVADSTGAQHLRTRSVHRAEQFIDSLHNAKN